MAAGALFVLGLFLAFSCNLLGYFVLVYQDQAVHWRREIAATNLKALYERLTGREVSKPGISVEEMKRKGEAYDDLAEKLRLGAIALILLSVATFVVGAIVLGFSLLPSTPPASESIRIMQPSSVPIRP